MDVIYAYLINKIYNSLGALRCRQRYPTECAIAKMQRACKQQSRHKEANLNLNSSNIAISCPNVSTSIASDRTMHKAQCVLHACNDCCCCSLSLLELLNERQKKMLEFMAHRSASSF